MSETLSSASQEVHKKSSTSIEKFYAANYPYLAETPKGKELVEKHTKERNQCDNCYTEAKQEVIEETKKQVDTVRPLQLSDIRSQVGLAHYINQSNDRWMQWLEQQIGLDSTWKILTLTTAKTAITIIESFTDILKFGEKTINGTRTLSHEDLSNWEKARAIVNGIGTDGLLALGLTAIGAGTLGKVVTKMETSQIATEVKVTSKTPETLLEAKMTKAEARSGVSRETVKKNANLSDTERLIEAERLMKEKWYLKPDEKLSEFKKTEILASHKTGKWVYENTTGSLNTKVDAGQKAVKEAGWSKEDMLKKEERRVLMENGIMGWWGAEKKVAPTRKGSGRIMDSEDVTSTLKDRLPDTKAILRYDGTKDNPKEVMKVLEEELHKVEVYDNNNLRRIFHSNDVSDASIFNTLNKRGNDWAEARFRNINILIEYAKNIRFPWLSEWEILDETARFRNILKDDILPWIFKQVRDLERAGKFKLSQTNETKMNSLILQVRKI